MIAQKANRNSQSITPEKVFEMYPWLGLRNQNMITHNDFDGILTALILHEELGWNLVGVYDLSKLYVDETFTGDLKETIYVDLDVTHKSFKSLGHHILGSEEGNHLNINRLFGIGHNRYKSKYPLSTALFLCWLFDRKISDFTPLAQLFLIHSDSAWKNHQLYTRNVVQWLERLNMTEVKNLLDDPRVIPSIEKFVLPHTYGSNHQCSFTVRKNKFVFKNTTYDMQKYVNNLSKILGFKEMKLPERVVEKYAFKRTQYDIPNKNLDLLLKELQLKHKIFSYSVKFIDKIDVTHF